MFEKQIGANFIQIALIARIVFTVVILKLHLFAPLFTTLFAPMFFAVLLFVVLTRTAQIALVSCLLQWLCWACMHVVIIFTCSAVRYIIAKKNGEWAAMPRVSFGNEFPNISVVIMREHIDKNNPENHTIIQIKVVMHPTKGATASMEIPLTCTRPSIASGVPPPHWKEELEELQRSQPAYDMVVKKRDGRMYVFTLGPASCVPKKWNFEECTSGIGMRNEYTKIIKAERGGGAVILRSYDLTSLATDTLVYIHGRHFFCGFLKQMHLLQFFADSTKGQSPSKMFRTLHVLLKGGISRRQVVT